MLSLVVARRDFYDESSQTFISIPEQTIRLEHSLLSISRWESKWNKPYLSKKPKTNEETIDYIRCMSVNKEISNEIVLALTDEQFKSITSYIDAPMTATTFAKDNKPPSNRVITTENIYGQMVALQIPFECEKWHFNRLMTLIGVCSVQNKQPKKMGKTELMERNRQINQQRRAQHNTRG